MIHKSIGRVRAARKHAHKRSIVILVKFGRCYTENQRKCQNWSNDYYRWIGITRTHTHTLKANQSPMYYFCTHLPTGFCLSLGIFIGCVCVKAVGVLLALCFRFAIEFIACCDWFKSVREYFYHFLRLFAKYHSVSDYLKITIVWLDVVRVPIGIRYGIGFIVSSSLSSIWDEISITSTTISHVHTTGLPNRDRILDFWMDFSANSKEAVKVNWICVVFMMYEWACVCVCVFVSATAECACKMSKIARVLEWYAMNSALASQWATFNWIDVAELNKGPSKWRMQAN